MDHSFEVGFFIRPQICLYCADYVWGSGYVGYKCRNCAGCLHSQCSVYLQNSHCTPTSEKAEGVVTESCGISEWSSNNVREWLAVVNLHRYSDVFYKSSINGTRLLDLNQKKLSDLRVNDIYHQEALLLAIKELSRRSTVSLDDMLAEQAILKSTMPQVLTKPNKHFFLLLTLTESQTCHFCERYLYGIIHQGLICQNCGLLVHRQCSYLCLNECKPVKSVSSLAQMHIFGANLFDLMSDTANVDLDNAAPLILRKSCDFIERRAVETSSDLYDIYRLSSETAKQTAFKKQLNQNGVELTNYDLYDLNTIASIIKSFLKELQNSLIPEEDYLKFLKYSIDTSNETFSKLIQSLHPVHFKCLKYICRHLIHVWNYQYNVRKCYYMPDKLIHIFRTIILRPKWTNIIDCVHNLDKQSVIVKRLLVDYDWGADVPLYKERPLKPPQYIPPLETTDLDTEYFIENELWFWPDITRDDTFVLLKHSRDGTYLVRKSTNNADDSAYVDFNYTNETNISTPYILCVVKGSFIKSIKIFQSMNNSNYDIQLPCRFKQVRDLIDYYSHSEIHELRLQLSEPLSKYEYGYTSEWNLTRLYKSYYDTFQQLETKNKKHDGLANEIDLIREDYSNKLNALNAYEKIISLYRGQIELLQLQIDYDNRQNILLNEQIRSLNLKISDLNEKMVELNADCEYLMTIQQQLIDECEQIKPELIDLRKKHENYHMWLIQRGENDERIMDALKMPGKQFNSSSSLNVLHDEDVFSNTSNWYSSTLTRVQSEDLLRSRPNGTFLVRTSTKSKYVLTLMCNDVIHHFLIDEDPQDACCYIKPPSSASSSSSQQETRKFTTLKDLILYYSRSSLKNYNPQLDTCLVYPALVSQ